MTTPEIIHNLKTNPYFAMEIAVDNNPKQVASNMAKIYGQIKEYSIDQLKDMIYEILDNGTKQDKAQVMNALKVRWIPEHASPSLNEAYKTIIGESDRIKVNSNKIKTQVTRSVIQPIMQPVQKVSIWDRIVNSKVAGHLNIKGGKSTKCYCFKGGVSIVAPCGSPC